MPTIGELVLKSGAVKTWRLASDKIIAGYVLVENNLGESKTWSLKWLADRVADGSIVENKDGSFCFAKAERPDAKAFA